MPSRRKGKLLCQRHANNSKKKGSDAQRSASKRKARGSHCPQGKGNRRRSKLTITNPDAAGIDLELKFTMPQCPKVGLRCRFAALAPTLPSSMS